jgi:hypothetical protein
MAIAITMAAVSTGVGVVAGTIAVESAMTYFLVSAAMGVALNALAPKPDVRQNSANRGYSVNGVSGSALDHQIIYGKTLAGGAIVYDCTTGTNNEYLHRILAFAGHRIEAFDKIYVDGVLVTLDGSGNVTAPANYVGFLRIIQKLGTDGQAAIPELITDTNGLTTSTGQWTSDHTLSGIAYLYVRFKFDANVFPNGVPVVNAIVKGKRVLDHRSSLTAWSDNAALCIRDYLTNEYGLNLLGAEFDSTMGDAAADICDQVVAGESRYTLSGAFTTASSPKQIVTDMLTSMGGLLWNSEGKWKMLAAAYVAPTLTLNEDDLRSGLQVSTRNSRRDSFNTVKGTFVGLETQWQEADYPSVSDPAFVTEDNSVVNIIDFSLPFTKTATTAQRIAKVFLFRNREQITVTGTFGLNALNCQIGDNVYITNARFGWSSKVFEVVEWSFFLNDTMEVLINMTLRETSSSVFSDVAGSVLALNNTTLPSPTTPADIGLVLTSSTKVVKEEVLNVLSCNVTSLNPSNVAKAELAYKKSTDTTYKNLGFVPIGQFDIVGLEDGSYDVQVRSYNYFGYKSDWVSVSAYVLNNSLLTIEDVSNFYGDLNNSNLYLRWDAVSNPDLSYYKIRHTIDETGSANWSDALTINAKVARPANSVTVSVKPGTYLIKAFNKSGIASQNAATFVVPAISIDTFTTNTTQAPGPVFAGVKTNTSVASSKLIITDTTTAVPSTGTYVFPTYIDTAAARRFRARIDVTLTRLDNGSGNIDTLPGNIDDMEGLWDALGSATSGQGDINVKTLISTTQTDPAGSPVWTPYVQFTNGQFFARAARFAVVLQSNSSNVTPAISVLTATVQY